MMRDQTFVTWVYNTLEDCKGCPCKHTAVIYRLVYKQTLYSTKQGGTDYRRLLRALNELEDKNLIWAQRGRDGTMWMCKTRDARPQDDDDIPF